MPSLDDYEVRIYDTKRARRLVAAIEIVSPANKDRPEHHSAFGSKCLALLQKLVSVTIIDLVTTREFNLSDELTEQLGHSATTVDGNPSSIYASATRATKKEDKLLIESWYHPLIVGQKLPTLPLWLAAISEYRLNLSRAMKKPAAYCVFRSKVRHSRYPC